MSNLNEDFEWLATEVKLIDDPTDNFATYVTPQNYGNIQGAHADHMLWLIDEAFSVRRQEIWETIRGSMTQEDNKLLFCGNYTVTSGYAHDAFDRDKALWTPDNNAKLFTFSSEDSPIVDTEWLDDMKRKWPRTHDVFRSRVLGLPPAGNPDAYIKREDIIDAISREASEKGQIVVGLDCARKGGDLTVFAPLVGDVLRPLITMPQSDEVQIYDRGINLVRELREETGNSDTIIINMDITGGYGSGAYDLFVRNKTDNIRVNGISYAGGGNDMCYNTTSVLWNDFKRRLPRLQLPDDPDLKSELSSRDFTHRAKDGMDKLLIESKEDFKRKNGGNSPDRSDAVTLATADMAIKRKVWEFFPSEYMAKIKADWSAREQYKTPMVSMWIDNNMALYGIICVWNSRQKRLFVLSDFACDNPHAESVLPILLARIKQITGGHLGHEQFEIFGNSVFFSDNGGDIRSAYLKHNVFVRQNFGYNEAGAIIEVERLISSKRIFIDSEETNGQPNVAHLPYDMTEWGWGTNGMAEKGYGMCRALLNIASALYEGYVGEAEKPLKAYSKAKSDFILKATKNAQERDIYHVDDDSNIGGSQGWMI